MSVRSLGNAAEGAASRVLASVSVRRKGVVGRYLRLFAVSLPKQTHMTFAVAKLRDCD